jgi:hypothetical protein
VGDTLLEGALEELVADAVTGQADAPSAC